MRNYLSKVLSVRIDNATRDLGAGTRAKHLAATYDAVGLTEMNYNDDEPTIGDLRH